MSGFASVRRAEFWNNFPLQLCTVANFLIVVNYAILCRFSLYVAGEAEMTSVALYWITDVDLDLDTEESEKGILTMDVKGGQ